MGRYIDGFVIPIPKDRIDDYRRVAEKAAVIWKEHGALDYWECIGDDMTVQDMVSFPQLAQAGPGILRAKWHDGGQSPAPEQEGDGPRPAPAPRGLPVALSRPAVGHSFPHWLPAN